MTTYTEQYLSEVITVVERLDRAQIDLIVAIIAELNVSGGRLFFLGVGGSAANCSHAVNDFRKIAGIETYTPVDNVSELTARTNDDGWDTVFLNWLKVSRLTSKDVVFVLSVGGGDVEKNVSPNLVHALVYAREVSAKICGIVGRNGGFTKNVADACLVVPTVNSETVTPHAEAFQAVIWHLIVSHPAIRKNEMKWEAMKQINVVRKGIDYQAL